MKPEDIAALRETEESFMSWVIDCAHANRWLVAHFRPAKTEKGWRTPVSADGAGFFDLVLARNGDVLLVEVKSDEGRLSLDQVRWGIVAGGTVWRPSMRNEIERILE